MFDLVILLLMQHYKSHRKNITFKTIKIYNQSVTYCFGTQLHSREAAHAMPEPSEDYMPYMVWLLFVQQINLTLFQIYQSYLKT